MTIQQKLRPDKEGMTIAKISLKFKNLMNKGNVNGALKLLTDNMQSGILPVNKERLELLVQKHPQPRELSLDILIQGPTRPIHPVAYDDMDESVKIKASMLTKGGSGPSGLDADSWCRILTSRAFGTATLDLCRTFAQLIKKLCVEELESPSSLESFVACRLIPLDRKPGLIPIGVGEVLRRIAGKAVMMLFKNDITHDAGALELSAGQDAGVEAVIHAMPDTFSEENTEAVIQIDAENAFNSINQKVMLHKMKFLCLLISTYISNCFAPPARLFIFGGGEILSKEGTTQGDPTSMGAYDLGILPMLHSLLDFVLTNDLQTRGVAFADDLTVAGKLVDIKNFWDKHLQLVLSMDIFLNPPNHT